MTIAVARDFSRTPGGRFRRLGPHSGEEFRSKLVQALASEPKQTVEVVLDDTEGYGSSFLEEAFGGLVRERKFDPADLKRRLVIRAYKPLYETYAEEAREYFNAALSTAARV